MRDRQKILVICIMVFVALLTSSSFALAQSWPDPGHPAGRIGGGTFNNSYGNFIFPTNTNLTADSPTFHVDATGDKVGIGTTSPTKKLSVDGEATSTGNISSDVNFCITGASCLTDASGTAGGWTDDGSVVRLTTSGDSVGIGTANPSFKLHVQGGTAVGNSSGSSSIISSSTGVWGSSSEYGVYGSGSTQGVRGQYNSNNYGYLGANGYGVYGTGTTWAGYFSGNATITDSLFVNNAITAYTTYSIALSSGDGASKNIGGFFNGSNWGVLADLKKSEVESDDEGAAVIGASNFPASTGDTTGALAYWDSANNQWVGVYGEYDTGGDNIKAFLANGSTAVYGYQGDGKYAGYFDGNVTVTENLTIGTGTILLDGPNSRVGIGTTDIGDDALRVPGTLNATNIEMVSDCSNGEVLKWSGGVGTCGTDISGVPIEVKQENIQVDDEMDTLDFGNSLHAYSETSNEVRIELNISSDCDGGSNAIRKIYADGSVDCETDSTGMSSWNVYRNGVYQEGVTSLDFNTGSYTSFGYDSGTNEITFNVVNRILGTGTRSTNRIVKFSSSTYVTNGGISDASTSGSIYIEASTGDVGIGDSSPDDDLEIAGTMRASALYDRESTTYYVDPANSGTAGVFAGTWGIDTTNPGSVGVNVGCGSSSGSGMVICDDGTSYGLYISSGGLYGTGSSAGIYGDWDGTGGYGAYTSGALGCKARTTSGSGTAIQGYGGYAALYATGSDCGIYAKYSSSNFACLGNASQGLLGTVYGNGGTLIGKLGTGNAGVYAYNGATSGTRRAGWFTGEEVRIGTGSSSTIDGDGDLYVTDDIECDECYTYTTTNRDLYVDGYGRLGVVYSTRKIKQDISLFETNFSKILDAETVMFQRIGDPLEAWEVGYIAEDTEEMGLELLIGYDTEHRPTSIYYPRINLYIVELLKQNRDTLAAQKAKINQQNKKLQELSFRMQRIKDTIAENTIAENHVQQIQQVQQAT